MSAVEELSTLPTKDLRAVFDIAVGSDGDYLDPDEVDTLRRVATRLGIDPMDATPYPHTRRYPHLAEPIGYVEVKGEVRPRFCKRCSLPAEHDLHQAAKTEGANT